MTREPSRTPALFAVVPALVFLLIILAVLVTDRQEKGPGGTLASETVPSASCPLPPLPDTGGGREETVPANIPDIDRKTETQGKPLETATFALG